MTVLGYLPKLKRSLEIALVHIFCMVFSYKCSLFNTLLIDKISTRSNHPEVFCKKGVLRNFAKFTGKHLCQSLFFNKVTGLRPTTFSNEIFKNTFFYRTPPLAASLQRHIFFTGYQTKRVIKFLFRKLMTPWTLRFIFNHPLSNGRGRGGWREVRNTKIWVSRERKELFRWSRNHFS